MKFDFSNFNPGFDDVKDMVDKFVGFIKQCIAMVSALVASFKQEPKAFDPDYKYVEE